MRGPSGHTLRKLKSSSCVMLRGVRRFFALCAFLPRGHLVRVQVIRVQVREELEQVLVLQQGEMRANTKKRSRLLSPPPRHMRPKAVDGQGDASDHACPHACLLFTLAPALVAAARTAT